MRSSVFIRKWLPDFGMQAFSFFTLSGSSIALRCVDHTTSAVPCFALYTHPMSLPMDYNGRSIVQEYVSVPGVLSSSSNITNPLSRFRLQNFCFDLTRKTFLPGQTDISHSNTVTYCSIKINARRSNACKMFDVISRAPDISSRTTYLQKHISSFFTKTIFRYVAQLSL